MYGGSEYAWRAAYTGYTTIAVTATPAIPATATSPAIPATTNTTISLTGIGGYGSPFANNRGCSTEGLPSGSFTRSGGGTCARDIRLITEGTLRFWHKFYNGPKGGLRWGVQYSYNPLFVMQKANSIRAALFVFQPTTTDGTGPPRYLPHWTWPREEC